MKIAAIIQLNSFDVIQEPSEVIRINNDFFIYNDAKIMPYYESPTRLDTTVISLTLDGYTRVSVNMQEYFVGPGTMMILVPDQIIHTVEFSDDYQCIVVAMSKNYTGDIFPRVKVMLPFFFYTKEYPCLNIKGDELNTIMEYYNMLWERVKREGESSKEIIQTLLTAFIYEIYDIYHKRLPRKREVKNRKEMVFDQFMRNLSANYKKERSVSFYAKAQFLTPKHLSSVIKEVSGKTAGEWIDNFVLFEAKTLLKSSQKNIQEISDELNFSNQSFFGKYFKHNTGVSPKEYRKM